MYQEDIYQPQYDQECILPLFYLLAQFIVHVRRGMISLQNVADTEYWITISGQHLVCNQ